MAAGKKKVAAPAPIAQALREYSQTYLDCRDMGHAWQLTSIAPHGSGWQRTVTCRDCPLTRITTYNSDGTTARSNYHYPGDYRVVGWTRSDLRLVRLESFRRAKVQPGSEAVA